MSDEFIPDDLTVETHPDGRRVRLTFKNDSGESREVVLLRNWLPQLLTKLTEQVASGQVVRIDRNSLSPGQDFSVQGWECQSQPGGGTRLVIYIHLPDQGRVVTIPLRLSALEADLLAQRLAGKT